MFVRPSTVPPVSLSASKGSDLVAGNNLSESKAPLITPKTRSSPAGFSGSDHKVVIVLEDDIGGPLVSEKPTFLQSESKAPSFTQIQLKPSVSRAFGITTGTIVKARLATYISVSNNAGGLISAVIAVNTVASVTEFASYAVLFREFFVKRMSARFQPVGRYTGPIGFVNTTYTQASGLPILAGPLHHGVTAPSNTINFAENPDVRHYNTSVPFTSVWKNIEKPCTVSSPLASTQVATQNWCLSDSTSSAGYTGQLLFMTSTTPAGVASALVGQFLVEYEVLFRYRE